MNIKSVRVLGKPFTIRLVDKTGVSEDNLGACAEDEQEISVRKNLPLETEQDTILHEVLHAIDHSMDTKCSEKQIAGLATGLLSVLKDNPEFLKYLSK